MMAKDPVSGTLGYLREMGMGLIAHCERCIHSDLVLDALIKRFGPEAVYIQRKWPLRCKRCGSREIVVMVKAKPMGA